MLTKEEDAGRGKGGDAVIYQRLVEELELIVHFSGCEAIVTNWLSISSHLASSALALSFVN